MKATLRADIIAATTHGDTEIGRLPAGVGIERLRWDGTQLIDLAEATTIHVRHLSGSHYELHCIPVPNSQPVAMTWADRRKLTIVSGTIRLKTAEETAAEARTDQAKTIRNRYARRMAALAAPYTPEERETWPIQLAEAEAYIADPSAPVAMLTEIAKARGITVAELAGKVITKNAYYRQTVGAILGRQQRDLAS